MQQANICHRGRCFRRLEPETVSLWAYMCSRRRKTETRLDDTMKEYLCVFQFFYFYINNHRNVSHALKVIVDDNDCEVSNAVANATVHPSGYTEAQQQCS